MYCEVFFFFSFPFCFFSLPPSAKLANAPPSAKLANAGAKCWYVWITDQIYCESLLLVAHKVYISFFL